MGGARTPVVVSEVSSYILIVQSSWLCRGGYMVNTNEVAAGGRGGQR